MNTMTDIFPAWVRRGVESGWIGQYEKALLNFLNKEYGQLPDTVAMAAVFVSLFIKSGHVCLPVDRCVGEWMELLDLEDTGIDKNRRIEIDELLQHPSAGRSDSMTPFVVEGERLFIRIYLIKERRVATRLKKLSEEMLHDFDSEEALHLLSELFPGESSEPDWQKAAAALALRKKLLIISGGPGTGKTTTIARIIHLLVSATNKPLRIALAAPTGKAAARMSEALNNNLAKIPAALQDCIPGEAGTLHRLLKGSGGNGMFPAAKKILPFDLVVIDEASMADLNIMDRLLSHLGPDTRLILSGDKDQLSSVEAGAVLGDICRKEGNQFNPGTAEFLSEFGISGDLESTAQESLKDAVIYLTRSYRFASESGISKLAAAVNSQDSFLAADVLEEAADRNLAMSEFRYGKEDMEMLFDSAAETLSGTVNLHGVDLVEYWRNTAWLGVLRRGPFGTDSLNRRIEEYLLKRRVISPVGGWYHGRPVMITRNDYDLNIFNGNLGVCVKASAGYFVLFPDHSGGFREIAVHRLRDFEPAYLLTVHKSQGSEFESVNLLLPPRDTLILTRELIYTAITRARNSFHVYGQAEMLKSGIERKTVRFTGMKSRLYPD